MRNHHLRLLLTLCAGAFCFLLSAPGAQAQYWYPTTISSSGNWFDPAFWTTGTLPTSSNFVSVSRYATVAVASSGAAAQSLYVGEYSTGVLNINTGGTLTSGYTIIGNGSGGTVNINGGTWTNSGYLYMGYNSGGSGNLNINSGSFTTDTAIVGFNTGTASSSNVTVSGGTFNINTTFQIAGNGAGSLLINGGTVNSTSSTVGTQSTGTATVSSGSWNVSDTSLYVGRFYGTGTLTLAGSGIVKVANGTGTVVLGLANTSLNNKLVIGNNAAFIGSIQAAAVNGGAGTGTVIFNQNNAYSFAPNLTGSLSLQQAGTGTTTLTGTNTYTGGTTVVSGKLMANSTGATGSGTVAVKNGGALGGTGSITGALTVESGGTLAPSSSTFTANGGISLLSGSRIALQLGTTSDLITAQTSLSLDQNIALALTAGTGFGVGQYTLIHFTGSTFTDNSNNFAGWSVTGLSNDYGATFSMNGSDLQVTISAVPEPVVGTTFALGFTVCLMSWRQRRRR